MARTSDSSEREVWLVVVGSFGFTLEYNTAGCAVLDTATADRHRRVFSRTSCLCAER